MHRVLDMASSYFVNLDWDTPAVITHADLSLLPIDRDLDLGHVLVPLLVVGSIDQDLIENLIQAWYVADLAQLHGLGLGVEHPHLLLGPLY